ncbi:hypothetical protein [Acinetobacter phage vB_AbaM_CP14]|nr:hypothetical protein [Acinetobacter phage vB_AbaM_CP14]
MEGFNVFNDRGELIIDSTVKNIGTVAVQSIGTITPSQGAARPAWFVGDLGIPKLPVIDGKIPLTLLRPNDGCGGCGESFYTAYGGDLIHLRQDYSVESGYLDVFDPSGNLIWSAISASKVPRVVNVINVTAQQIKDGVEVYIGNSCIMMNGWPAIFYPGPMGTSRVGGIYWQYTKSTGMLKLQYSFKGNASIIDYVQTAYGDVGFNIYLYEFGT